MTRWRLHSIFYRALFFFFLFTGSGFASPEDKAACGKDEVSAVIREFKIAPGVISECKTRGFAVDGKPVHFVHIAYGAYNDCASGCFNSSFCALVDDMGVHPYHFFFAQRMENLFDAYTGMNDINPETGEKDNPGYDTIVNYMFMNHIGQPEQLNQAMQAKLLPGMAHKLTRTADFQAFARKEIADNGEWRYCFSRQ